jgi:nitroreductase
MQVIAEESLDRLFRTARSSGEWSDEPVPTSTLRDIYDLSKWGPSSMNTSPARYVFIMSGEAKERLSPHLAPMNRAKALGAPVCAIVGYDLAFDAYLPTLFPHRPDAASLFADPELRATTAFRNGSLQGAYFILAARALGLDCGPMSGFDNAGVDQEFFAGTNIKSNFLCALGRSKGAPFPRLPRLAFEDACRIL